MNLFIFHKYLFVFLIYSKCKVWARSIIPQSVVSPWNVGNPFANQMTYSLFIKQPVLVTNPPINAFNFQTEDDYFDQMEAEMQWINDRHRLEQQNIDSGHRVRADNKKHQAPLQTPLPVNQMKPLYNNNYMAAQNPIAFNPYLMTQKSPNQLIFDQKITQNENITEQNYGFNATNIWEQFPPNISNDIEDKSFSLHPIKQLSEFEGNTEQSSERTESTTQMISQWEKVVDESGKTIEKRVITLPDNLKNYHFPKGLYQIGKTEIITESEEVMTATLKPIIEEKEFDLPEKRFH